MSSSDPHAAIGRWRILTLAMIAATVVAAPATAHKQRHKALTITHPWVAPTPDPSRGAAVHLKIANDAASADDLLSATTPRAARVVLQKMGDGADASTVARIPLPAGSKVELGGKPYRIWLDGLRSPLGAYDSFPMTLRFAKAGEVAIEVLVDE
jgi:copper(I)-binding protein